MFFISFYIFSSFYNSSYYLLFIFSLSFSYWSLIAFYIFIKLSLSLSAYSFFINISACLSSSNAFIYNVFYKQFISSSNSSVLLYNLISCPSFDLLSLSFSAYSSLILTFKLYNKSSTYLSYYSSYYSSSYSISSFWSISYYFYFLTIIILYLSSSSYGTNSISQLWNILMALIQSSLPNLVWLHNVDNTICLSPLYSSFSYFYVNCSNYSTVFSSNFCYNSPFTNYQQNTPLNLLGIVNGLICDMSIVFIRLFTFSFSKNDNVCGFNTLNTLLPVNIDLFLY